MPRLVGMGSNRGERERDHVATVRMCPKGQFITCKRRIRVLFLMWREQVANLHELHMCMPSQIYHVKKGPKPDLDLQL